MASQSLADSGSAAMEIDHTMLNTKFPVLLPDMVEARSSKEHFDAYIRSLLKVDTEADRSDTRLVDVPIRSKTEATSTDATSTATTLATPSISDEKPLSQFMDGLLDNAVPSLDEHDGKMLTENADVAHRTSGEPLVDLFYELEDVISGGRLRAILGLAWEADADATLKIIWNARSIHLGKSSRTSFYRAVGWLAENHPLTLLTNLPWLVRPLVQKKAPKAETKDGGKADEKTDGGKTEDAEMINAEDADSDFELVDVKAEEEQPEGPQTKKLKLDDDAALSEYDVRYGVAHGYWKDLLNILALAANDELKVDGDPRSVLNVEKPKPKKLYKRDWTQGRKKTVITERYQRAVGKLKNDSFYKALHLTVARLFADQLRIDGERLASGSKANLKRITLAAKWAPSHKGMHDQHTCIVSTIAELLHSFESVSPHIDPADRSTYLKHARQAYQLKTLSPLRKHLDIVERSIGATDFASIKYDRIPSLAMKQYTSLFAKKDFEHFDSYIEKVASGKARISGATLLPSTLVSAVAGDRYSYITAKQKSAVEEKMHQMQLKSLDGQWNTLVQRMKDSGTLQSSIAVCDVSGSMTHPRFPDKSCPMDSAIGLSLLMAEVTKPPFGGAFITFSAKPQVMKVGGPDDKRTLEEKLILRMAIKNKLTQEDMVKQVFVFSDMQFDQANDGDERWSSSYERIQKRFKVAGYEMPKLIFWNLAGGRAGYDQYSGDETAPKPVTAADEGTAFVSGYSQGQMKMFLENGQFEDPEEDEVGEEVVFVGKEGMTEYEVSLEKEKKKKMDAIKVVRKAIGHEAYRMLKVVD